MKYKRKQQGKTDYRSRLNLLKSKKPRLVVRRFLKNLIAQVIDYKVDGDKVLISAHTSELKKKYNWKHSLRNTPSAYLLGLLIALKCKDKKIKELVLDIGLNKKTKGSLLFVVLKGAIDGGLNINHNPEIFIDESRIKGEHIKNDKIKSKYTQSKPDEIVKDFETLKQKLKGKN